MISTLVNMTVLQLFNVNGGELKLHFKAQMGDYRQHQTDLNAKCENENI